MSRPLLALLLTLAGGCSDSPTVSTSVDSGMFSLLTYNVAGLPEGASASRPAANMPLISPMLNHYDIALVQEDFYYHEELRSRANHKYQSNPKATKQEFARSDGLNRFSFFRFGNLSRMQWSACSNASGSDCLAEKGYSVAETELATGVVVDIYNVHLDAGGHPEDIAARSAQAAELVAAILSRSAGKAVIVAGDLNLDLDARADDLRLFASVLQATGLTDACRSLSCGTELVDRVLFRGAAGLELTATSWMIDNRFVNSAGQRLSDHFAVGVDFRWQVVE